MQLALNIKLCLQSLMVSPLVCAEEREQEEAARREKARFLEMDEDEYDALPEEQKTQFNNSIRQAQRERKKRSVSLPWTTPQDSVPEGFPCSRHLGFAQRGHRAKAKTITSGTRLASSTSLVPNRGRTFFQ